MKKYFFAFIVISSAISLLSCDSDLTPKPRGYFRIDLPERQYISFDSTYPYTFEYPTYAKIVPRTDARAEAYWINLSFPCFRGELNISYKSIKSKEDLQNFERESFNFTSKHVQKASSIDEQIIRNDSTRVYGTLYDIQGIGTASSCQFVLTDSVKHFFRGALYFNARPNNDSLAPVLEFVKKDINHLIKTFRWKN
ncbi:MAG: gliding motility lipoprotein GldD [Bacteroidota bacterium]